MTLARRGTSNGNVTGSAADRRARRAFLVARDGWPAEGDRPGIVCCYQCGVPLLQDDDPGAPGQSLTVDRIVPGCDGGRYTRDNIRAACGPCNSETGGAIGGARSASHRVAEAGVDTEHSRRGRADTEHSRALPTVKLSRTHDVLTGQDIIPAQSTHESTHATHGAGALTFPSPPRGGRVQCPVQ